MVFRTIFYLNDENNEKFNKTRIKGFRIILQLLLY